ncbi:L-threonylcarbamoyladenylate synthase [Salimicrobium halophilum]|uniref:Threonylcarbamoyl-AMP synthase n=1 Tax=Salimicrobium halophilum TaxID=86666 RepID=A0A1G8SJ30_9BACI|nr:L-threonylcarbamoyladenylate synthase [Salimicrobium halophilum]SDJ28640.1 translation factor SUA5 [Salimicrobium halophilum]
MTRLWKQEDGMREAAEALSAGEAVAFPTETVYGLGADATREEAVQKIFDAKGRPADNPLIVHIGEREELATIAADWTETAEKCMDAFWPGPLTIIVPSNGKAAKNVTAGLQTIGVRMPDHPTALKLLREVKLPIAAPSANSSGKPSPTSAEHVYQDLNGKIAGIVDGGRTGVGVESTVVDCTAEIPVILRPGGVTKEQLEEVFEEVRVDPALSDEEEKPKSPGMKYRHYAPEVPLLLVEGDDERFVEKLSFYQQEGKRVGVIASRELAEKLDHPRMAVCGSRTDLSEVAVELYGALRSYKQSDVDVILAETFEETEVGAAVMNRLKKAADRII